MPLLKNHYTSEDYWNLPEGERAELIDGKFYDMAPPSRIHQRLVSKLTSIIDQYISDHHGPCQVYPAPFAVNLDADDKDWVEPDVSVICDPNKLTDRGCSGAPAVNWTTGLKTVFIPSQVSGNTGLWTQLKSVLPFTITKTMQLR